MKKSKSRKRREARAMKRGEMTAAQGGKPAKPAPGAAQGAPQAGAGNEPTPQEQEGYERVVVAAVELMQAPDVEQPLMKMLEAGANDPATVLAQATAMVMQILDEKSGGTIPQVVILPAAQEILTLIAENASAAGLFEADDETLARAVQKMVPAVADVFGVDEDELVALLESIPPEERDRMVAEQQRLEGGGQAQAEPAQAGGMVAGAQREAMAAEQPA